jgi:hypothetical protein
LYDALDGHIMRREQQLRAKYRTDESGFVYAYVEYNGEVLRSTVIGFNEFQGEHDNECDADIYCDNFNESWVMIEKAVEALNGVLV